MNVLYGLKLWSTNHNLFSEAAERHAQGQFDFIELYIVPGHVDLQALKPILHIPITIHAPHENHHFNVFTLDSASIEMFTKDVMSTADVVKAEKIVVHAGVGNSDEKFISNFSKINDPRIVIENMPKIALDGTDCYGYSLHQIEYILHSTKRSLCLDVGHAIKSAVSQGLEYKEFLGALFNSFHPSYFHISDGILTHEQDEHVNVGSGNYDFAWIKENIRQTPAEVVRLVFEVPKNGTDLSNDIQNISEYKKL